MTTGTDVASLGQYWLRTYVVDGVSTSGINEPSKTDGLAFVNQVASAFGDLTSFTGTVIYKTTLAALNSDLAHPDGTGAIVWNDPTASNNAFYILAAISPATWDKTGILLSSAIATTVAANTSAISALQTGSSTQSGQISATSSSLAALTTSVGVLSGGQATLSATVAGHTTSLGTQSGQISATSATVATISATVSGHTTSLSTQSAAISGLQAGSSTQSGQISGLLAGSATNSATVSGLAAGSATQSGQISALSSSVSSASTAITSGGTAITVNSNKLAGALAQRPTTKDERIPTAVGQEGTITETVVQAYDYRTRQLLTAGHPDRDRQPYNARFQHSFLNRNGGVAWGITTDGRVLRPSHVNAPRVFSWPVTYPGAGSPMNQLFVADGVAGAARQITISDVNCGDAELIDDGVGSPGTELEFAL